MFRFLFLVILIIPTFISAQVNKFQTRTFKGKSGLVLPYRLYVPTTYTVDKPLPIVLTLHGSGERGSDNVSQISANELAMLWAADSNQTKYPSFVVAPQCPANGSWWSSGNEIKTVIELLDSLGREFSLNPNKLYVAGLSMGGFGAWGLIATYPNKFAAAVPICGGGDTSKAVLLKSTPIWAFHGASDPLVPVAGSQQMIAAIKKAGGTPKYTEYPGVGHDSWVKALREPELVPWLFSQSRSSSMGIHSPKDQFFISQLQLDRRQFRLDGKSISFPFEKLFNH